MNFDIKKIVLIGPESTGKSTLCEMLAEHFNTRWVKEHAREYLLKNGTSYTIDDLGIIARNQMQDEDEMMASMSESAAASSPFLFIDTDMYVMKVWSEFVFGQCHPFILDEIVKRKYDLYLLCKPDIPWTKDELREYPDHETRQTLYHHYQDALVHQHTPWVTISGDYTTRLQTAIKAVEDRFMICDL